MKKSLFFALFACATLAFVGCEPKPEPDPQKDPVLITVTPDTLNLGVGDTEKLAAVVAPSGTQVQITWTSDNEEVVTVTPSGIVLATGIGTANVIASAEGATSDTCLVNVTNTAILDEFVLGGYGFFGDMNPSTLVPGTDTIFDLNIGNVKCQIGLHTLYAWDEDVLFIDGSGFSGAGFFMVGTAPVYYIVEEGPYYGYYIDLGFFGITKPSEEGIYPYVAEAGEMIDVQKYGDAIKGLLNAQSQDDADAAAELYDASMTGTQLFIIDFENQSESNYLGNVKYAYAKLNEENQLMYDLDIEWFDFISPDRFLGLLCQETEDETGELTLSLIEPYDMKFINKSYTNMPIEEETLASVEAASKTIMPTPKQPNLFYGKKPVLPQFNNKIMFKK